MTVDGVIDLTRSEASAATAAGAGRTLRAIWKERRDAHGFEGDGWQIAIDGAGAEIAFARWADVYHDPFTPELDYGGDVAGIHVRSTPRADGCLTVYQSDPPGTYVLVVGRLPKYRVVGWSTAREAKQRKFWRTDLRDPAFMVPQRFLQPIESLALVAA